MSYSSERFNLRDNIVLPSKFFTFCMVSMIVLNTYTIGPIAFGEILMFGVFLLFISKVKIRNFSPAECAFYLYAGYSFIITFLNVAFFDLDYQSPALRMLRDAFYLFLIFVFAKRFFDYQYAIKLMNMLAVILSAYILIQFFAYLFFGVYVPGVIPGLNVGARSFGDIKYNMTVTASILGYIRPNGFLAEPSNCGHFLALVLFINLHHDNGSIQIPRVMLYIFAILCTTSANGIVLMGLAFLVWFFQRIKTPDNHNQLKNVLLFGWFLLITAMIAYMKFDVVQNVVHRLLLLGSKKQGSGAIRVIRGIMFYKELPLFNKVFGIGFGNFDGIKSLMNINTEYEYDVEYMSMDSYILVSAGIIGVVLILFAIFHSFNRKTKVGRGTILLLMTMGLSSSVYSTAIFAVYLAVYLHNDKSKNVVGSHEHKRKYLN